MRKLEYIRKIHKKQKWQIPLSTGQEELTDSQFCIFFFFLQKKRLPELDTLNTYDVSLIYNICTISASEMANKLSSTKIQL